MADEAAPQEDRTEAATPRRLQKARDAGNIPVSREVAIFAGLAAATLVLAMSGPAIGRALAIRLSLFLEHADAELLVGPQGVTAATLSLLRAVGPVVAVVAVAGAASVLLQTGFIPNLKALAPDLGRISPRAGLRRLLGTDNLVELGKSIVRMVAVGFAIWRVTAADMPALMQLQWRDPRLLASELMSPALHVLVAVLLVQAVLTVLDVGWVRFRHSRQMRMSRQNIRDEVRESEGDPRIKARIRQIRQQRARRRMMAAVPAATVVVTNPTHYAVALAYDRTKSAAPRVVAKGVDAVAARIREVALANRVPLVANPPLARALYTVELETEIPAEHFQAVAELIAYVWRLNQRARL